MKHKFYFTTLFWPVLFLMNTSIFAQKTELDKILKAKGCNTLYLCGLSAVGYVLATYFGGMERDYKVFMVKEGIISHNSVYTNVIKDICETVSFETVMFMLGNLK